MARAIGLEVMPRDAREELRRKLEQAPEQHSEALLESYELLQQLHDSGVLKLLRGALASSDKIVETVVQAANSTDGIRALRNAIILGKMLGSINTELLQSLSVATVKTLDCQLPIVEAPKLLKLFAEFREPELRRSMALINKFLETFGTELKVHREAIDRIASQRDLGGIE